MITDLPYMNTIIPIWMFMIGACFGSFANVVIYRWPQEKSFVTPRSTCPHCNKLIKFYENIPILSWVFLRGKCSGCKNRISIQYPLVELLTGLLFLGIYLHTGMTMTTLEMCIFTVAAIPCFFIDLKHMLLPDIFTISGIGIGLLGSALNPARSPLESVLGALLGGGAFYLLALFYKKYRGIDGMGGGDIKLIAWLGALMGVGSLTFIMLISSVTGSLFGFYFLFIKKKDSKTFALPFGPFLILAAYCYYFML